MLQAIAQTQIPFSFLLGTSNQEALVSLSGIKDAFAAALVMHAEDELSLDQRTLDHCRLFYQAADNQFLEILNQEQGD